MWLLHWAGLGFLKAWQPQVPYMQLKAPRQEYPKREPGGGRVSSPNPILGVTSLLLHPLS